MENKEIVKGLILTVGFSVDPIIKIIKDKSPERVIFLGTEESIGKGIDRIIEETKLKPSMYRALDFPDKSDAIGKVISKFREGFKWINSFGIKKEEIVVDSTTGKKWMSSGATMIASFLGFKMVYVDAKYNPELKEVDPSTMKIVNLGNAYDQTGFVIAEQGREAFNNYNYEEAQSYFSSIRPSLSHRADFFQGLAKLSKTLARWDRFEHYESKLSMELENSISLIDRSLKTGYSSIELVEFVDGCKVFMEKISELEATEQISVGFLVDIFLNAKRRFAVKRFDDSVARLYRTLEAVGQYFLFKDYDIDVTKPIDWEGITEEAKMMFREIKNKNELPPYLDLYANFILLKALEHPVSQEFFFKDKKGWNFKLLGKLNLRNNSILAHGFKPIGEKECTKFLKEIEDIVSKNLQSFEELEKRLTVPKLPSFENLS